MRLLGILLLILSTLNAKEPIALYATLAGDAAHSITIHALLDDDEAILHLNNQDYTLEKKTLPISNIAHFSVTIQSLKANTRYFFSLNDEENTYSFSTLPEELDTSVKFVVGGDMYHDELSFLKQMLLQAAHQNPDIALLGGDLAYAAPKYTFLNQDELRWLDFIKVLSQTMMKENGDLIPLVAALGNHDISGYFSRNLSDAPYYQLFFLPENGLSYFSVYAGKYLKILILDTNHAAKTEMQIPFIESELTSKVFQYTFALYHVPAFPSYRSYYDKYVTKTRSDFVPLFEKYSLNAAFEHHDHVYKRTFPIKEQKVNFEKGVVYIGDGAFGIRHPRTPKFGKQYWYLLRAEDQPHFILVEINDKKAWMKTLNDQGDLIDYYQFTPLR